jgi:predicted  nucleic acid-binding Zn-ribbon protein
MRIEATVQQIRDLFQLAELDAQEHELPPDVYRSRREASRSRVASALLERYERLIEAGRYPALVAIDRGSCAGCHIRLPTMVESHARRSPCLLACPSCRRLVYAREHVGEERSPPEAARKKGASRRGARP